ncbi:MAG: response regulator transcription factor [Lachnospiraceae bacterium]|nr:response regulator transcription factor [Lachnospiraceae bacterium]MBR4606595.1 response regulator transcription factor [Lachnospiraceae bacterium]
MPYKTVIAEDFKMIRQVFEAAVNESDNYELAASFPTAQQAMEWCEKHHADLVLMDVLIPGSMNGLDAARRIKEVSPDTKIIIVTSMPELSYERQAREIGVESFWQKEVQEQTIQEIMDRTMAGESVYPGTQQKVNIGEAVSTEFTDREIDILKELVSGASNAEIAEKLGLKEPTVKMHIKNMLQKTGYRSRLELAVKVRHMGLIIGDME